MKKLEIREPLIQICFQTGQVVEDNEHAGSRKGRPAAVCGARSPLIYYSSGFCEKTNLSTIRSMVNWY